MNKREIGEMKKTKARNVQCICIKRERKNSKKIHTARDKFYFSTTYIYLYDENVRNAL